MPTKPEQDFLKELKATLNKSRDIRVHPWAQVGAARPDLTLEMPDGKYIAIETKTWDATPANKKRATHQAHLYQQATGADDSFVLLKGLDQSKPAQKLLSHNDLVEVLMKLWEGEQDTKKKKRKETSIQKAPTTFAFAAMPFAGKYDDTFILGMQPAALEAGADCQRVDHVHFSGDTVGEIKRLIRRCAFVIADLSESRPNVLYELGFAEAMKKPVIQICSTPADKLPFNVRNNPTIKYTIGQVSKLKAELQKAIGGVLPKK